MKAKTILNTSGALVTLGGAAVGSYYALNNKASTLNSQTKWEKTKPKTKRAISEWLKNKSSKPMLATNSLEKDNKWNNKWGKFKDWYEKNKENNDWQIFDWDNKKSTGDAYNELKKLCETNSKKETDEEDSKLLNEVILHCLED